jgi:hypothetical protein
MLGARCPTGEVCPPRRVGLGSCLVDPQQELIESLTDSELSGVAQELQKEWDKKPRKDRERDTVTNMVAFTIQRRDRTVSAKRSASG